MIRAIIVDDEKPARLVLSKLIEKFLPQITIVGEANSVMSGVEAIHSTKPDLVFLDIEMPGGNGFNLLSSFDEIGFDVIFTTAYAEYALKAIKFSAHDYLTKPIDPEELKESIAKLLRKKERLSESGSEDVFFLPKQLDTIHQQSSKIVLPIPKGLKVLPISEIIYCEASGSYTEFHFVSHDKILVGKGLKFFDEKLVPFRFHRVHDSFLVNLEHVTEYIKGRGGHVILSNNQKIDVSARKRDALIKALTG